MNQKDKLTDLSLRSKILKPTGVRTTFKINKEATEVMAWARKEYGLTPKQIFAFMFGEPFGVFFSEEISADVNLSGTRKTFVVERGFLKKLNDFSKKKGLGRDVLVNAWLIKFKKLMNAISEKMAENRKKAAEAIEPCWQEVQEHADKIRKLLPEDDPIHERLEYVIGELHSIWSELETPEEEIVGAAEEEGLKK